MLNLNIRTKVVALVSGISIVAYIGFAVFMYNAANTRQMYRTLTRDYIQSVVQDDVANFTGFLNSIEFASVGSPTIGELYYKLRNELSKEEMTKQLAESYKLFFSRSSSLLGGGAFYEPNAFYADQKDFHMFASKPSVSTTNPKNINAEATWDVDTYAESWYQIALPSNWNRNQKRDKALYWSELYVDSSVNVLMTSVCAPMYDENNKIIGVGTVDVSLETLQNMVQAFKKPTENSNIVGFSTLNKATFATADKEANNIKAYPSGSWLQELSKLAPNDNLINHDLKIKDQSYTLYASVHQSGMGFAMLIPNEELFQTIETVQNNNLVVAIVICTLMLITTIIGVALIRKWLITPLGHLTVYASEIETGNLNAELKGNFTQEMGLLSRTITNMVQFLKKEMHNAAEKSKQANKLAEDADQAKKEVEKSLNVETLRRQQIVVATQELSKVASQLSIVSQNISSGTQEIKKGSQLQHEQLQDVVQYMNEMRSSVGAVASSASQAAEAAKQSKTEALNGEHIVKNSALALQDISEQAATLMEKMKILGDKSNSIGSIMTMIEDIADQTNLLALNAAIEAARAGEAGRGFAVVADEVRKLAEKTMSATSEVTQAVKAIQLLTEENSVSMQNTMTSITKASEMANESNQGLKTIVNIAQTTAEEVNNIANASEKQSASVQTIGESVEQVFNIANRTTEQVENTVLALKDLMSQTEQLQQVMSSLKEDSK